VTTKFENLVAVLSDVIGLTKKQRKELKKTHEEKKEEANLGKEKETGLNNNFSPRKARLM
jgi:hypothetical protein